MNITPRIKSTRNHKHLIVNVSIEIPLNKQYQQNSLSPSPTHRKKCKLIQTQQDKKTSFSNNLTYRDTPYMQTEVCTSQQISRKKQTAPSPLASVRGQLSKYKSTELSPRKKCSSRRGKESRIVRNISILQQVSNDEDNIIKYTTNSNELKDKIQSQKHISQKVQTHVSQVDILQIRDIEYRYREGKESQSHRIATNFLRTACAKKIQRAWRRYRTKQLIRSYSNDIRKKDAKKLEPFEELTIKSARSQGGGLKLKMKNIVDPHPLEIQTERGFSKMTKFHEESIEKWQQMLEKIKNQKNIDKLLQISLQRTEQLRHEIGLEVSRQKVDFFGQKEEETPIRDKIIKTKGYYEQERQKRRDIGERSVGSIQREERVKYFQNQMLKIQNDLSQISSDSRANSQQGENVRELEEIENLKLRKKLQIFKEHLPQIQPFASSSAQVEQTDSRLQNASSSNRRVDIATIIKKKAERPSSAFPQKSSPISEENFVSPILPTMIRSSQRVQLQHVFQQQQKYPLFVVDEQLSSIQTHRDWTPLDAEMDDQESNSWKTNLSLLLTKSPQNFLQTILEQLILQSLIQISQSQKLIQYIKTIYQKVKKVPLFCFQKAKPQGIVTSHASIKDYLNYFINYLYGRYGGIDRISVRSQDDQQFAETDWAHFSRCAEVERGIMFRYFRGEELPYDPDSEYVMNIKIFNEHWKYANQFIYFDPKWQDPQKEAERVGYLKQLTKVFFRSIFDCFNESLQFQRIYGMKGKPYPWSIQRLNCEVPNFRKAILDSFQRVIKMSTVFCGVLFQDKQHNLDKRTMDEIQQENIVKLIMLETEQDEILWNFFDDELVEIKLEISKYVEQRLIMEVVKIVKSQLLKM